MSVLISPTTAYLVGKRVRHTAHMISDKHGKAGTRELRRFGLRIGLRKNQLQYKGEAKEHFNVMDSFIFRAFQAGAERVDHRKIVEVIQSKRRFLKQ